jgi:hypothetical protein
MKEVTRVLKEQAPSLINDGRLQQTLQDILNLDHQFGTRGGIFFHTGSNAFETAEKFTRLHVMDYRQRGRPSLPALAIHHAQHLQLDENSPVYKALVMVAVHAEMQTGITPEFHNKFHYTDVAAMAANLLEKNNALVKAGAPEAVALTKEEQALAFIAALGHDLDHPGLVNPANDLLFNERNSFQLMEPLLKEAGLPQADIGKIETILLTTSPDGPHSVLKGVAHAQREGRAVDFSVIDPQNKFPALRVLEQDVKLTQMAAIVSDSDLYASSGAGIKANRLMSAYLSDERKKEDPLIELATDRARKVFLDDIVGRDGYASYAGRVVAGDALEALRKETERRLAPWQKQPVP